MLAKNSDLAAVVRGAAWTAVRSRSAIHNNKTTPPAATMSPILRRCVCRWAAVRDSTIPASLVGYPYHFKLIVENVPSCTMVPICLRNKSATRAASDFLGDAAMAVHNRDPGMGDIPNSQVSGLWNKDR